MVVYLKRVVLDYEVNRLLRWIHGCVSQACCTAL